MPIYPSPAKLSPRWSLFALLLLGRAPLQNLGPGHFAMIKCHSSYFREPPKYWDSRQKGLTESSRREYRARIEVGSSSISPLVAQIPTHFAPILHFIAKSLLQHSYCRHPHQNHSIIKKQATRN